MDNADDKYRVQIALRPTESDILHTGEQNYEELFSDVFETERVILFIPYVNSVSVYMNGEKTPSIVRVKQNDKWCVSDPEKYVGSISPELTEELNRRIKKGDGKIPEKYYNFHKTSVGFACRREGNKLCPVVNSCLYCYLPNSSLIDCESVLYSCSLSIDRNGSSSSEIPFSCANSLRFL